ncbi:DUF882 domain-containing protein [Sphingomonas baiyangensis]|uniref:DUF882 domain-containing protein n=2 Tax=Sphingomonas baiyangensis TaxID=2572576 RepID=A0A4U1L5Q0_9SPHN|nr:DUF882 domain-containing protein [Sphingomonas baiyangensis]
MQLSKHFNLREFTRSQTAARRDIPNVPGKAETAALKLLCEKVLEPIREQFGPVMISSGYRSPRLNAAIGSGPMSQHTKGQAADFEVPGVSNYEVARWVQRNLAFDQLILEMWKKGDPNAGWIHVSFREPNRNQVLTYDGRGYSTGLRAA